jgi:membrane-bound ClpP family serine protease
MGRLLLIIGMILIVLWLLGFFAFQWHSPIVHALIIIGVILVILDLANSRRNWW